MGSTNKTPNLELSSFVDDDRPTWRGDYNADMGKIDTAVSNAVGRIGSIEISGQPGICYVSPAGVDTNSGNNPSFPKQTLKSAYDGLVNGGVIKLSAGVFTVDNSLTPKSDIIIVGNGTNGSDSVIQYSAPLFDFNTTVGLYRGIIFENVRFSCQTDNTHLISASTLKSGIYECYFNNVNFDLSSTPNSSVVFVRGGAFLENSFHNCVITRSATATVPAIDVIDSDSNTGVNTFNKMRIYGSNSSLAPAIRFESSGNQTYVNNTTFTDIVGEQNGGGLIHMFSQANTYIRSCSDWDLTGTYSNDVIKIAKSPTNTAPGLNAVVINSGHKGLNKLSTGLYSVNCGDIRGSFIIGCGAGVDGADINSGSLSFTLNNSTGVKVANILANGVSSSAVINATPSYASGMGIDIRQGISGMVTPTLTSSIGAAIRHIVFGKSDASYMQDFSGNQYWGPGDGTFTVALKPQGSHTLALTTGDFCVSSYTSALRPAANTCVAGTVIFDKTLNKPLWSTGVAWNDAMGNVVT